MIEYEKVAHVGLDNHKNFGKLTARDAANQVLFRQRLEYADRAVLHRELSRFPAGTPVVVEGTFGWGWLAEELAEAHLVPHLASSGKVAAWRTARGMAKSNRIDGDLLSELWPQQPAWWEVWLAPVEVRDRRELLRYRMALVAVQTATKNRIHAVLHRHGILHGFSDVFGIKGLQFLQTLLEGAGDRPLREIGRQVLAGHLQLLGQVRRQIAAITRVLRKLVAHDEQAERWRTVPGIGWVLAYTIHAEVGEGERFIDGRHLASYSLLAPRADDSGEEDDAAPLGRHVGHAGRRTLKWAFIEAAHGAVKKDAFFRDIYQRRTNGGTRDKNRGYIAVARKLCTVGLACVKNQQAYRATPPLRPGSAAPLVQESVAVPPPSTNKHTKRKERRSPSKSKTDHPAFPSGSGQPDPTMAGAGL